MIVDEMVECHQLLSGHEFEQTQGDWERTAKLQSIGFQRPVYD